MERLFDTIPEYTEEIVANVKGQLPDWLQGRLFRIGPGKFDLSPDFSLNHWFDGCAILYSLTINDGKVTFKSRFLNSEAYEKMTNVQRPVFTEFGTRSFPDPCKNVFSRFLSQLVPLELTDNAVANIYPLGGDIYCTSETTNLWKIDTESLKAIEKVDLNKLMSVNMASSHPQQCPDEGSIYNLGASLMTGLKYNVIKIPPQTQNDKGVLRGGLKKASVVCTVPSSWTTCLSYYHSFGLTPNYLVFLEQPLLINTMKLATSGVKGQALKECFDWTPKEKTRFIVIEKESGRVLKQRYVTDALFMFHHVNAYEEDGHLVVDVIAFDDVEILDKFYLANLRSGNFDTSAQPQPRRYVLPIKNAETVLPKLSNLVTLRGVKEATAVKQDNGVIYLSYELISNPGYEMPKINPNYVGRKYRYFYASGVFERAEFHNAAIKVDVLTKETIIWRESDTMYPGEMDFVPNPDASTEDDGVLLTVVLDVDPEKPDFLLVLDAMTWTEVARVELQPEIRVPLSFHGFFQEGLASRVKNN